MQDKGTKTQNNKHFDEDSDSINGILYEIIDFLYHFRTSYKLFGVRPIFTEKCNKQLG